MNGAPLTAGELTGDEVISVPPDTTLASVAATMAAVDIGAVAVGTLGEPTGVVSERDIVRAVASGSDLETVTAGSVASTELVWVEVDLTARDVAAVMMTEWVRHVLVREDGQLAGIVSARDLVGTMALVIDED